MTGAFVSRGPEEGEKLSWRAEMLVKAGAADTGGAFTLIESTHARGGGPPLHVHSGVDEAFYVLDGEYDFFCGPERVQAGPGGFVLLPRGVPHRYRVGPQGGRVLMLFSPGGAEDYFRELAAAMAGGDAGDEELAELARHHGIDLLGSY